MGTVNGLESGVFGPDINTQRLILPAGRQWEKDTGRGSTGEREPVCPKQSKLELEMMEQRAEEVLDLP